MKKYIILLITILCCFSCGRKSRQPSLEEVLAALPKQTSTMESSALEISPSPEGKEEQETIGVWLSYLDLYPFVSASAEEFQGFAAQIAENCASLSVNTLIVQVRAFGDSLYPSEYFPPASCCREIDYDPFALLIDAASDKGIRVEAWINPLRCLTLEELSAGADCQIKQWAEEGKNIFLYGGRIYLDPASKPAKDLIVKGVKEILEKYPVSGIHIDDYFYPEGCSQTNAGAVTSLVEQLYQTVKKQDPKLTFGVSPRGVVAQNLFIGADISQWIELGIVDYLAPQIYFGFEHQTAPFIKTLSDWQELLSGTNIKLIAGLAAYKLENEDSYAGSGKAEWTQSDDIIKRQVSAARNTENYGGILLFRYASLFSGKAITIF